MLELPLSDGVSLRLFEERDASELAQVVDANREYLARWMPWPTADTEASSLEFIRATRRQLADNNGIQTAVTIGGANRRHGRSSRDLMGDASTSIGYWLAEEYQGRGAITSAVRAYTDHAFGVWRFHRVEIEAAVDNTRSRAIPERLGFRSEGVRRQAHRVGERYHDVVAYSMLAPEWHA